MKSIKKIVYSCMEQEDVDTKRDADLARQVLEYVMRQTGFTKETEKPHHDEIRMIKGLTRQKVDELFE